MAVKFSICFEEIDIFFVNKKLFENKVCCLNYDDDKNFYFIPQYRENSKTDDLIFHFSEKICKKFFKKNTVFNFCEISKANWSAPDFLFVAGKIDFSVDHVYFDEYENSTGKIIYSDIPKIFYKINKNAKIYQIEEKNHRALLELVRLMQYRKNNYKILEMHKIHAIEIINIFCINILVSYEYINKLLEIFDCRTYNAKYDESNKKFILEKYNQVRESVNNYARIIIVNEANVSNFPFKAHSNPNTYIFILSKLKLENHNINHSIKLNLPEKQERDMYISRLFEKLELGSDLKDSLLKQSGGKSFTEINYSINHILANGREEEKSSKRSTLDDIHGYEYEKEELRKSFILPIQHRKIFQELRMKETGGILLYGPPGCGKTSLAQAVANELNMNFYFIKAAQLLNKYVGETERNIRELFERARAERPTLLFFDEIDTIASKGDRSCDISICNTLLTEMDSLNQNSDIFIIATTNNRDSIVEPLLRPGRFDKHIHVKLPTLATREAIFQKSLPDFSSEKINKFAKFTEGFSGAHILQAINEAKEYVFLEKIKNNAVVLTENFVLKGIFKVKLILK